MINFTQKKGKYDSDIELIIQQNYYETNAHSRLVWYLSILMLVLITGLVVSLYIFIGLKKKYELLSIKKNTKQKG